MDCTIGGANANVASATSFLDVVERQVLSARGADQHISRTSMTQPIAANATR